MPALSWDATIILDESKDAVRKADQPRAPHADEPRNPHYSWMVQYKPLIRHHIDRLREAGAKRISILGNMQQEAELAKLVRGTPATASYGGDEPQRCLVATAYSSLDRGLPSLVMMSWAWHWGRFEESAQRAADDGRGWCVRFAGCVDDGEDEDCGLYWVDGTMPEMTAPQVYVMATQFPRWTFPGSVVLPIQHEWVVVQEAADVERIDRDLMLAHRLR